MRDIKGLFKSAALFGLLLSVTHYAHYMKAEAGKRERDKAARRRRRKMRKALKAAERKMRRLHDHPPVRIPVPPDTRN